MEAAGALKLQSCSWAGVELAGRRPHGCSVGFSHRSAGESCVQTKKSGLCRVSRLRIAPVTVKCRGHAALDVSCCYKNPTASTVESESSSASLEDALNLQKKSQEVVPYLNGRCIYLVGMMGSGKTTVGKIISEVLGYSFFDSDKLVEQAVGAASVAQIFQEHSESFFRDNESKVLEELSAMRRMVVATGGGAVIRPINWRYMKHGVTVWLDVPLEALARRIAAVGTNSRPLLHDECGDPYTKAFMRLTTLWEERGEAYANADAKVSLQSIAAKEGHDDVSSLTPTAIAIEALERIQDFIAA